MERVNCSHCKIHDGAVKLGYNGIALAATLTQYFNQLIQTDHAGKCLHPACPTHGTVPQAS